MSHSLRFAHRLDYDPSRPSITIPVELRLGAELATVRAKLDTGASHCVFRCEVGEMLGLAIDSGEPLEIASLVHGGQAGA